MFFSSGLTKEHSLSYQLWNLNYAMEFFRESSTDNYDEENVEPISKHFQRNLLTISWLTLSINFRLAILSVNSILICMRKYSWPNHRLCSAHIITTNFHQLVSRISIRKWSMPPWSRDIIPIFTNKMMISHSAWHRRQDHYWWCWIYRHSKAEQYAFLASTSAHSMLTLPGLEFKENQGKDASSVNPVTENDGTYRLSGIHHRIPNTVVEREVLATSKGISINDNVIPSEQLESQVVKRDLSLIQNLISRFLTNLEWCTDTDGKEVLFIRSGNATFTLFRGCIRRPR